MVWAFCIPSVLSFDHFDHFDHSQAGMVSILADLHLSPGPGMHGITRTRRQKWMLVTVEVEWFFWSMDWWMVTLPSFRFFSTARARVAPGSKAGGMFCRWHWPSAALGLVALNNMDLSDGPAFECWPGSHQDDIFVELQKTEGRVSKSAIETGSDRQLQKLKTFESHKCIIVTILDIIFRCNIIMKSKHLLQCVYIYIYIIYAPPLTFAKATAKVGGWFWKPQYQLWTNSCIAMMRQVAPSCRSKTWIAYLNVRSIPAPGTQLQKYWKKGWKEARARREALSSQVNLVSLRELSDT